MAISKIPSRFLDLGVANFFLPEPEEPPGNQITVEAGFISQAFPQSIAIQKNQQTTTAFNSVTASSRIRWDLVYINKDGTVLVEEGTEQADTVPEFTGVPNLPRNSVFQVAYIRVNEPGAVEISIDDITDIRSRFHFFETTPPGVVQMFMGGTAPLGWLFCRDGITIGNGSSGATFAGEIARDLFEILKVLPFNTGTEVFDNGDTVKVPDMRGRGPMGFETADPLFGTLGANGGSVEVDTSHIHDLNSHTHGIGSHTHSISSDGAHAHGGATQGADFAGPNQLDGNNGPKEHTHVITSDGAHTHGGATGASGGTSDPAIGDTATGGDSTQSIVQPYLTVNFIIKL